jgi:hypothetical protein
MLGNRDYILGSRLSEQGRPFGRFKILGFEARYEILVAEIELRPKCLNVVLVFRLVRLIHVARVPLRAECRHRVNAPMDENSKLCVQIPGSNVIAA